MKKIVKCKYNIDTGCVEIQYANGSMLAINGLAVEHEFEIDRIDRSELDWLIYNKPFEYAQLVLSGKVREYLKGTPEHRLMD